MAAGKKKRSIKRWRRRKWHIKIESTSKGRYTKPLLVGFDGIISVKRLRPATRSRADKLWETSLKQEYEEQCYRLEKQMNIHENLLQQMKTTSAEKSCLPKSLQELHTRHTDSLKFLRYLLKGIMLPLKLQERLIILGKNDKDVQKLMSNVHISESSQSKYKMNVNQPSMCYASDTTPIADVQEVRNVQPCGETCSSSNRSSPPLQLFVYGIPRTKVILLSELYPVDKGSDLINAIARAAGRLPSASTILHGSKRVVGSKSLQEQGILNEANIYLTFKLLGGMKAAVGGVADGTNIVADEPRQWGKQKVTAWVDSVCQNYEIHPEEVSKLKTLNGAGLSKLKKEDWINRSPQQGDLFYGEWTSLLNEKREMKTVVGVAAGGTSAIDNSQGTEGTNQDGVEDDKETDEKESGMCQKSTTSDVPVVCMSTDQSPCDKLCGIFGEIEDLEDIPGLKCIDELINPTPQQGSLVAVSGYCSSRGVCNGQAGSVLLRNDPTEGNSFSQIKVDFRSSDKLTKHKIKNILGAPLGDEIAVLGRVEKLEDRYTSRKEGFIILPFKVVVDSDTHGAVRKMKKFASSISRQHSTPWPTLCGVYPAEDTANSQPLYLGDVFERGESCLFLPPNANNDKIKECVVALRNCQTGDIFIGVNKERKIVGEKVKNEQIIRKREDLMKAIGGILPCVDCKVDVCKNADDALTMTAENKSFIAFMLLRSNENNKMMYETDTEDESVAILIQIHITKGTRVVHFVKQSDNHAYARVGTETKVMSDFEDFYGRLESLSLRNVNYDASIVEDEIKKASNTSTEKETFMIFKRMNFETGDKEFKAVYGDPRKIIVSKYISEYAAAFLNTQGGEIYFGVEEDKETKVCYATGIVLSSEERKRLLQETAEKICNFWPPVPSSQFLMSFIDIEPKGLIPHVLKFPKTSMDKAGQPIVLRLSSDQDIGKANNIIKEIFKKECNLMSLVRVQDRCYCILSKSLNINVEQFVDKFERSDKQLQNISLECIPIEDLQARANDLCVVRLKVEKSPLPIHLTMPLVTYVPNRNGEVRQMSCHELIQRLQAHVRKDDEFDIDKFSKLLNNLDKSLGSFIIMTAPFELPKCQQDLVGLVVPEWTMVLDFDQKLNSDCHLFSVIRPLHDLHQAERRIFLKTPNDRNIEVNSDNGVCWYAVRGYDELADTLSKPGHGEWNMKHGDRIKSHLKEQLIYQVNPNHLYVVCLCNHTEEDILPSMQMLVEQILSLWSQSTVIFVCPDLHTKRVVDGKLIEPLANAYTNQIKRENVFVVPIDHLARHLAGKLQSPFRPENAFQLPKREGGDQVVPETLPQDIRQAINGHLQMMYLQTGSVAKKEEIEQERVKFFSGSAIGPVGLANNIGFKREKLKEVKNKLKSMLKDTKSQVSMVVLKAERGSGATTLCHQLLYEFHKQYPCAQLTEFHKNLVRSIKEINKHTTLPLIMLVDSDMAHLQDFTDLKNEAEVTVGVNVIFIVVDSEVTMVCNASNGGKKGAQRKKKTLIPYITGTAPYQIVELNRELEQDEMSRLVQELRTLDDLSEEKEAKLLRLQEDASKDKNLRKFAYFSLTVFGKDFTRLEDYVRYRLDKISETQAHILDFLAITHAFTESYFPVNVLSKMLGEKVVLLESVFNNPDVYEFLSPPLKRSDGRRISFGEVAEEILRQRSLQEKCGYVEFLKTTALRLATKVLSTREPSKRINRLNRRLFVTSEYEHNKYSPLIRYIKDGNRDTACTTLKELTEILPDETPLWAHLQAHLGKFYMQEYDDFKEALSCIRKAINDQPNDNLLRHIHGDIIRLQIQNLVKLDRKEIDVETILRHAIESSSCFEGVRQKRPFQEHGYTSDVLVRRLVMEAVVKSTDHNFLKSLCMRLSGNTAPLRMEDRYLLSLIPEAFDLLEDVQLTEHTQQLKKYLISNIGSQEDVEHFCREMISCADRTTDEAWVQDITSRISIGFSVIEMERNNRTPEAVDKIILGIESIKSNDPNCVERAMKKWIRYIRESAKVPNLEEVCEKVTKWNKDTNGESRHAAFYKYVTELLKALQTPKDNQKMEAAGKAVDEVRRNRPKHSRSLSGGLPYRLEWFHPKQGHHISSIDCLLHDDDFLKEHVKGDQPGRCNVSRDIIEKALFEQDIRKWEGVVESTETEWKGTIYMKRYIPVHFVPAHARPFPPQSGDTVKFCLSFDWNGPHAWDVVCQAGQQKRQKAKGIRPAEPLNENDETSSESDDEESVPGFLAPQPLHKTNVPNSVPDPWDDYRGKEIQGVVVFTDKAKGFGKIQTPYRNDRLYFRKSQYSLDFSELQNQTPVVCKVQRSKNGGLEGVDICVIQETEFTKELRELLSDLAGGWIASSPRKHQSKVKRYRLEGEVINLLPKSGDLKTHGFIKVEGGSDTSGSNLFFHVKESGIGRERMKSIKIGSKLQFSVGKSEKGKAIAKEVYVQGHQGAPPACSCGWEHLVEQPRRMDGVIQFLKGKYGFILNPNISPKGLYFEHADIVRNDFRALNTGMQASFIVRSNAKGCIAKDIVITSNIEQRPASLRPLYPPPQLRFGQLPSSPYRLLPPRMPQLPPRPFGFVPRNYLPEGSSSPTSSLNNPWPH